MNFFALDLLGTDNQPSRRWASAQQSVKHKHKQLYSVSQKKVAPLKRFVIFSLVNLCN